MNTLSSAEVKSPNGKNEQCIEFVIDNTEESFVFHRIVKVGQEYTFSSWIMSDENLSIRIGNEEIDVYSDWEKIKVTFVAKNNDFKICFCNPGTYYLFEPQLEEGNAMTGWTPAPEDVDEEFRQYVTTIELKSAIEAAADEINLRVSGVIKKVDGVSEQLKETEASLELKVDKDKLISEINATADTVKFESNNFIVKSKYLQIDEDGTLTTKKGKLGAFDISEDGLVYGDVNSRAYTQISGDGIRWISGIEEQNYNEFADRIENYYENRVFQFYHALKEAGEDSYDLTPVGGLDANGIYAGESYADWVNNPADYLVTWDGIANLTKLGVSDATKLSGNLTIGKKTAYLDGKPGFYFNPNGYMHIQRKRSDGFPYISFLLDKDTTPTGQIYIDTDNDYMRFAYAAGYMFNANIYANKNIKFAPASNGDEEHYIGAQWADGNHHYLLSRAADGLTSYFGWSGSEDYETVTSIRGRTCRYINSSGTTTLSDERLKEDFAEMDKWESFYNALEPIAFKMKSGSSGRYHMGFRAQQIERALTENGLTTQDFAGFIKMKYKPDSDDSAGNAVYKEAGINEGDDEYGLIYTEFVALNTYQIQKLKNEFNKMKCELESLKYLLGK